MASFILDGSTFSVRTAVNLNRVVCWLDLIRGYAFPVLSKRCQSGVVLVLEVELISVLYYVRDHLGSPLFLFLFYDKTKCRYNILNSNKKI